MFIIIGTNNNIFISGVIKNHTAFFKREYIKKRGNFFIYKKFPLFIYIVLIKYYFICTFNNIGVKSTVIMTTNMIAGNISCEIKPAWEPFCATINATSPRDTIPIPTESASLLVYPHSFAPSPQPATFDSIATISKTIENNSNDFIVKINKILVQSSYKPQLWYDSSSQVGVICFEENLYAISEPRPIILTFDYPYSYPFSIEFSIPNLYLIQKNNNKPLPLMTRTNILQKINKVLAKTVRDLKNFLYW